MAFTWHQRDQFKHKFQKMVRYYNLFNKWVILTQNFDKGQNFDNWALGIF